MITNFSNFKKQSEFQETELVYDEISKSFREITQSEKININAKIPDSNFTAYKFFMNDDKKIDEYFVYLSDNFEYHYLKSQKIFNIKFSDPIFEKRKIEEVYFNNVVQKTPCIKFDNFIIEFKFLKEVLTMSGRKVFEFSSSLYDSISYSLNGDHLTFHILLTDFLEDNIEHAPQLSDIKSQYGNIDLFSKYIN